MNITPQILSGALSEALIEELDIKDSELNNFIDAVTTNIILNNLSEENRVHLYTYLACGDHAKASKLIEKEIPDFRDHYSCIIKL